MGRVTDDNRKDANMGNAGLHAAARELGISLPREPDEETALMIAAGELGISLTIRCAYFASCTQRATGYVDNPALGRVPCCVGCAQHVGAELTAVTVY